MQPDGVKINAIILLLALYNPCYCLLNRVQMYASTALVKKADPDTTTLVTRRDKPLRRNDSMSLVPSGSGIF